MPAAEIIAIGTELLLGEIQDTNTRYLARKLRDIGVDIYRATVIGDNANRIAQVIRESMSRAEIVITTGGLGPTVDDPTRQAVALAVGVDLEFCPELWQQILDRFSRFNRQATENNRRQAYIPVGAIAIENAVGTAPSFYYETPQSVVISLPGVPREMEYLSEHKVFPYLKSHFKLEGTIKALVFHTAGVGESQIDEWIGDLETLSNPTVGLLAHPGQVDIRITAKAGSTEEADDMIARVATVLRERLRENVYGTDNELIEEVVNQKLSSQNWKLTVCDYGLDGEFNHRFGEKYPLIEIIKLPPKLGHGEMENFLHKVSRTNKSEVILGVTLESETNRQILSLSLLTPQGYNESIRSYGGSPSHGAQWAVITAIDYVRRNI